jgi:heme/copper-type cytochrome/quinol oxidase subunit 4
MTDVRRPQQRTNWPLVLRHTIPAIYVPVLTLIAYGTVLAVTRTASLEYAETVGFAVAGSSLVLVFARLASREPGSAARNVTALATICVLVIAIVGAAGGAWRDRRFLPALAIIALGLALAALIGVRWARRWKRWRTGNGT